PRGRRRRSSGRSIAGPETTAAGLRAGFVVSAPLPLQEFLHHCVARAKRAWASRCAARSSNVASLMSTTTLMIWPVKANGEEYLSDRGEQVSQPTSNASLAL